MDTVLCLEFPDRILEFVFKVVTPFVHILTEIIIVHVVFVKSLCG